MPGRMGKPHLRDEEGLTLRERQVIELVRKGLSQSEIARRLGISRQRVSTIKKLLRRKGVEL